MASADWCALPLVGSGCYARHENMMPEPSVASSGQAAIVHLNNRRIAYYWSVYRIGQRDCGCSTGLNAETDYVTGDQFVTSWDGSLTRARSAVNAFGARLR